MTPAVPAPTIPDYELLQIVGRGSYGDVWLARSVTGLFRAVKIVWRDRFSDCQPYEREFRGLREFAAISITEARQLALLHVGRHDDDGFFYYVMELADDVETGREITPDRYQPCTLKEVREKRGRLPAAEAIALAVELARALSGLHTRHLVHRDIKPSNIILVGGVPKLADIGLIVSITDDQTSRVGNAGYMPPDLPGTPSADVFGLGKVLYELATGCDRDAYPRLPPEFADWPDRKALLELNEVFIRACAPDPARRYKDAPTLLEDLLLLQAGRSVRKLRSAERHLATSLRVAAFLAIVATIAAGGAWIEHRRAAQENIRRREAEAQRDELARQAVYAATLAQAQQALLQNDFGRARQLLQRAAAAPQDEHLRGFEWQALSHRAHGDPCEILRESGPAIDKLTFSPDQKLLAVHDTSRDVVLYNGSNFQEERRIKDVLSLAGFSADGQWLLGTDTQSALQRWSVTSGAVGGAPYRPAGVNFTALGVQGPNRIVAFANGQRVAIVVWDFSTQRLVHSLEFEDGADKAWRIYRGGMVDGRGDEAVVGLISGRSNSLTFRITLARLADQPMLLHQQSPVRPATVGYWAQPDGQSSWWIADDATGRHATFRRETNQWQENDIRLPRGIVAQTSLMDDGAAALIQAQGSLINISRKTTTQIFHGHSGLITAIAPLADGRHFFSASQAGELRVWDTRGSWLTNQQRQCWDSKSTPSRALYSPDGNTIYVPEDGHRVAALDARTLTSRGTVDNMLRPFAVTESAIWGLSADGYAIQRADTDLTKPATEFARAKSPIVLVTLSGNGRRICLTRLNGELWSMPAEAPANAAIMKGAYHNTYPLELDYEGNFLWNTSTGLPRTVHCRRVADGQEVWSAPLIVKPTTLRWLQRTSEIVVALENGDLEFFDAYTGAVHTKAPNGADAGAPKAANQQVRAGIPSGSSAVQSIALSRDAARLVVAGIEGDVHIIETDSGRYLAAIPTTGVDTLHFLSVAPDESSVAVLTNSGMLHMIRTR